ncbi:MAG: Uncharacterised protein [SAR116 cluster bacterium]|nr:MAG: Uncharacterised protein [SAR116 cluster bacterium]
MIFILRVAAGDQPEIMHEFHQPRGVLGSLEIPDGCGMAARLIGTIHLGRDHRCGHRLEFLRGHQPGGILRADDIHPHAGIGTGMQDGAGCHANGIGIENLFNGRQPLTSDRHFLRWCESRLQRHIQRLASECLQHLAKHNGIGPAGADEFQLLWAEGW